MLKNWILAFLIGYGFGGSSPILAMEPTQIFFRSPESKFPSGEAPLSKLLRAEIRGDKSSSLHGPTREVEKEGVLQTLPRNELITLSDLIGLEASVTPLELSSIIGVNLQVFSLRTAPDWRSESVTVLARWTPFRLVKITTSRAGELWAQIEFREPIGLMGYVELSNVALSIDFMESALGPDHHFHHIGQRLGDQIIFTDGSRAALGGLRVFIPDRHRALWMSGASSNANPTQNWVRLKESNTSILPDSGWHQSELSGHGIVFWKAPAAKSEVFSAKKRQNGILRGDEISLDQGQHFQHFLHWDELAHLLQIRYGSGPEAKTDSSRLTLEKSEWTSDQKIKITLRFRKERLFVEGLPFQASSWRFIGFQPLASNAAEVDLR